MLLLITGLGVQMGSVVSFFFEQCIASVRERQPSRQNDYNDGNMVDEDFWSQSDASSFLDGLSRPELEELLHSHQLWIAHIQGRLRGSSQGRSNARQPSMFYFCFLQ